MASAGSSHGSFVATPLSVAFPLSVGVGLAGQEVAAAMSAAAYAEAEFTRSGPGAPVGDVWALPAAVVPYLSGLVAEYNASTHETFGMGGPAGSSFTIALVTAAQAHPTPAHRDLKVHLEAHAWPVDMQVKVDIPVRMIGRPFF